MKIDVRGLKKVASDKKTSTFITAKGHKFIVAHKGLKPEHQKQMQDIPHYAYGAEVGGGGEEESKGVGASLPEWATKPGYQAMSEASEAKPELSKEQTQQFMANPDAPYSKDYPDKLQKAAEYYGLNKQESKFTADVPPLGDKQQEYKDAIQQYPVPEGQQDVVGSVPPEANAAPMEQGRAPAEVSMAPQAAPTEQAMPPNAAVQSTGIAPADQQAAAQDKGTAQDYQKGFHDFYQENAQKLGHEDAAWQHDLQNGHVAPQTYHDLFAKRDTLGKIGMLFGLLVSGAGSGMAHQSNAVLDSMNKEIENDYNAQVQSKGNAQNFLKIHQQQALNEAQIKHTQAQLPLLEAQTKSELATANINAQAATMMKMNRAALHELVLQVQKMPQGPQKVQAEQSLAMVSQAIDAKNFNIADVAAGKGALAKMIGGVDSGGVPNTTMMKMIPGMEGVAKDIEEKTVPGVGRAQIPVSADKRDRLTSLQQYDQKAKEYVQFANQHSMNWANLNPVQRSQIANQGAAMGANLQSLYRNKIKGGVYKKGEQEFIQQIIPDNPASWSASFKAIPKVMQTIHDNTNDLQTESKSVGLKTPQAAPESQVSKSGRPMVQKNGKWYYQK